jgi:predicted DNA-binding antitoxin AbrB/MazE fold protein
VAGHATVDAVLEGGVLKPLNPLDLPERQRVRVTIDVATDERPDEAVGAWLAVYDGLAEEDVDAVAAIVLDRPRFVRPPP